MLAYLRGTVQSKEVTAGAADRLVLETAGVGFELSVSRRTLASIGGPGEEATLFTSLSIRETEWTIFGFSTQAEREMFGLLQSVSGVGPKLAMAVVATLPPEQLAQAILSEDHKLISQAPGVGTKVAQRITLELQSKVEDWKVKRGLTLDATLPAASGRFAEVQAILEGLGYTASEINLALKKAQSDGVDHDVELLVRQSLKLLGTVN